MKKIVFKKDGSKQIKLDGVTFKPYTLEQILNIPSMFYKVFSEDEDEISEGVTKWFNYKGLTYVQAQNWIWC